MKRPKLSSMRLCLLQSIALNKTHWCSGIDIGPIRQMAAGLHNFFLQSNTDKNRESFLWPLFWHSFCLVMANSMIISTVETAGLIHSVDVEKSKTPSMSCFIVRWWLISKWKWQPLASNTDSILPPANYTWSSLTNRYTENSRPYWGEFISVFQSGSMNSSSL